MCTISIKVQFVFLDSSTEEITVVLWEKGSLITSGVSITSSTKFPWDHEEHDSEFPWDYEDHDSESILINQTVTTTPPVQSPTEPTNVSSTDPTNVSSTDPTNVSSTDQTNVSPSDPSNVSSTDPTNVSSTDQTNLSSTNLTNVSFTGSTVIPGKNMVTRKPINMNIYEDDYTKIIAPVVFVHCERANINSSISFHYIIFSSSGPNVSSLMMI